ncbi:hypothetical protein LLEC1_08003 [Akanthomyces lecanii]|uniref:Uncharacterized protein n=1 Tax=Cordyceps confragosa TaxID=2714763 RepID=A0A179I3D6_CORDF|nr:hypothetical protein LLEC1_08003 [Akanthomyces lecanii]
MSSNAKIPENLADLQPKISNTNTQHGVAGMIQQRHTPENTARRNSINDQHAKPGFFGQAFHNIFGRHAK